MALVWTLKTPFVLVWLMGSAVVSAHACSNPIVCENQLPGDTGWEIAGSGDTSIQGFAADISIQAGQTVDFKINTGASSYRLDIYRLGYYGGSGARKVDSVNPSVSLPQIQPSCLTESASKLIDCGNWEVSASWQTPSNAVSGIYFARLVRSDTGGASHIFFVIRNDARASDILYQTSDETWQAYNPYGGKKVWMVLRIPSMIPAARSRSATIALSTPLILCRLPGSSTPSIQWFAGSKPTVMT